MKSSTALYLAHEPWATRNKKKKTSEAGGGGRYVRRDHGLDLDDSGGN